MASERIPGVALAIVRGNEIVHARGFGTDGSGRSITPQTPFIIGSMSKAFTAVALMQLVDAGRIDLDAPVQRYLPEFRVADSSASANITIRQLLYHTSGIPTNAPQRGASASLLSQVEALSDVALSSAPGTRHQYASPNYIVLGAIVERLSGISFGDYVSQNVVAPLHMMHTYVSQREAMDNGMSRGHRYWFGFPVTTTLPYESGRLPTASIISSAEDMAHFVIAQLNAGSYAETKVLSANAVAQMHKPGVNAEGFSYAMGWRVTHNARGGDKIHHGGIVPHFRGKIVMLPESGWGVVVLTNVSSALPLSPASHRMADNIAASLTGDPLPAPGYKFKLVHLIIALAVLLLSTNQVRRTTMVLRGRLAFRSRRKELTQTALGLMIPIALLVALPLLTGVSWNIAFRSMPDITIWVVVIASVDVATRLYLITKLVGGGPLAADGWKTRTVLEVSK